LAFWPLVCFLHIEFYSKIRDIFRLLIHCILFTDFWTFFPCISTVIITQVSVWPLEFFLHWNLFSRIPTIFSLFSFLLFSSFYPFRHVLLFIFLLILFQTFFPCIPTVIDTQVSVWPLECLLHWNFSSRIRDIFFHAVDSFFFLFSFSSCPFVYFPFNSFSDIFSMHSNCYQHSNWNLFSFSRDISFLAVYSSSILFLLYPFRHVHLFIFLMIFFRPFFFLFHAFWTSFSWFSVWTSVLSFCLIILVFARMSLRVNYTARRFLMIIHACWVSVSGWGCRRSCSSLKTYYSNPHYLITLKNSWSLFLENFLINPTSLLIFLIA